jgi:hypothetical protein
VPNGREEIIVLLVLLLCSGFSFSQCMHCSLATQAEDCKPSLHSSLGLSDQCAFGHCDPTSDCCVFERYTGEPCGDLEAQSPYRDECHIDVCIDGRCMLNQQIDSSNPSSAGGAPPLTRTNVPWIIGRCEGGVYLETYLAQYCGDTVCNGTETNATCCTDCSCALDNMCINNMCTQISSTTQVADFSTNWDSWIPLVVIALLIGYFLAALAYMFAHIIGSPDLQAWAKNEFFETNISALLVGSALFFVGLTAILSQQVMGVNYIEAADLHVRTLAAELMAVYAVLTKGIFAMSLMSSMWGSIALPIVPLVFVTIGITGVLMPFRGLDIVSNTLLMFTNILSFAIFSVIGQKLLLDFILQTAFRILLPIAIFLRCFTFTRKLGATLIAIAIGAYIVYPITLVMNANVYASVPKIPFSEYHSDKFPIDSLEVGSWTDVFMGPNFGKYCKHWYDWLWFCWLVAIIDWVVDFIKAIFDALLFMTQMLTIVVRFGPSAIAADAFEYYASIVPWAIQPVTAAFLFPIIDIIIVVTAIRSLSEAIGGESRITGLAQFI